MRGEESGRRKAAPRRAAIDGSKQSLVRARKRIRRCKRIFRDGEEHQRHESRVARRDANGVPRKAVVGRTVRHRVDVQDVPAAASRRAADNGARSSAADWAVADLRPRRSIVTSIRTGRRSVEHRVERVLRIRRINGDTHWIGESMRIVRQTALAHARPRGYAVPLIQTTESEAHRIDDATAAGERDHVKRPGAIDCVEQPGVRSRKAHTRVHAAVHAAAKRAQKILVHAPSRRQRNGAIRDESRGTLRPTRAAIG